MNIGEIIGEYIYLKPLGEDFVGRCPFCLDQRMMMVVSPELKSFECLHCGESGGVLHFIRRIEAIIRWDFRRSQKVAPKHIIGTVYVLSLEQDCYYIGFTQDLPKRLAQHFAGKGALWTRKYQPVKLVDVYYDVPEFAEHRVTRKYIERYGYDKVRGGNHLDARNEPGEYHHYPKRFHFKHRPPCFQNN